MRAWLDSRCAARGGAVFLWFRGRTWSYADLARITDGAAAAFSRLGLRRGDRAAVLLPNGPSMIFSWLALAKLGVTTAPLHPQSSPEEARRMLEFVEPAAFIHDQALAGGCVAADSILDIGANELEEILRSTDPLSGVPASVLQDPADILLTSGTTGSPKGVVQQYLTYKLTGEGFAHWLGLNEEDRLFTCLPLSHINARGYSTMGALASGGSLALEERFSASRFWGWLAESGATQANAIGAMLQILLKSPASSADRAHRVRLVYSAPALPEEDHLAFEARFGARLVIGYGLTESTYGFIHPLAGERRLGTMGVLRRHPDAGLLSEARLVEGGRETPDGKAGEVWLRNPAMFSAYYRDDEATRAALTPDGWLRTGDLAVRDAGWYTFVGRIKEIIRRRGENIAPAEVESTLMSHPAVREAAVVGAPSPLGEEEVAAFVVLDKASTASSEELQAWCAARLSAFKVPTVWRFLDSLPRTTTQRVAKHLLKPG